MELNVDPFTFLSISARNKLNVNNGEWWKTDYDLILRDERGDSAHLQYRYTQDLVKEINLRLNAKLTNDLDAQVVFKRNELEDKDLERSLLLKYHRQCWSVDLGYADEDDDRRFLMSFSLYGIGGM